ncbi:restriction endonuclease, partial [Candidatus Poribacteria bacterium]|nr:restriction endonuclease [Candidatus Poribacteria bacterium]
MEHKARIEVATSPGSPNKQKGDLLEELTADLLEIQDYTVTKQLRITAAELDLLCEHRVNRKIVYVECKAYRESISANVLNNLLGKLTFNEEYQEGWLISTGPLGKDAKGFQHDWEKKPNSESQKLSIYTPERVIRALISAGKVKSPPYDSAVEMIGDEDRIGDPTLLITQYGIFWTIACLESGVPVGVLVYSTKTGNLIKEQKWLRNLAQTDTSQNELDFEYALNLSKSRTKSKLNSVVEVEHGETWADYRPARPQDFVGREGVQE